MRKVARLFQRVNLGVENTASQNVDLVTNKQSDVLAKRAALITGGSSGIGLGFARAFASYGWNLIIVGRNLENLHSAASQLEERYGVKVRSLSADLSTSEGRAKIKALLQDKAQKDSELGPIAALVNNAGVGLHLPATSCDEKVLGQLENAVSLMVSTPLELAMVAGQTFQGLAPKRTFIINVASVNALVPMGTYSALKAFLRTYSQALALKMQGTNVQVVTFMPGWTHTQHHQRAGISTKNIPAFLWLNADEIARQCLKAAFKGADYVVPSAKYRVLACLASHGPRRVVGKVMRSFNKGRAQTK